MVDKKGTGGKNRKKQNRKTRRHMLGCTEKNVMENVWKIKT
jgi:hypothetical protein